MVDSTAVPNPPAIPADDKDWTWVLQRRCPDCGFASATLDRAELGDRLRANAATWADLLGSDEATLRRRPAPQVWSPLEYACHVRDVFRRFDWRLELMLTEDDPRFENWDQDSTALAERYDLADPVTVRAEVLEAAATLAARFDAVTGTQWERRGYRSDGAVFTVDTFGRYLLHDPVHHLHDVGLHG
jgi:hypothetical protein